MGKVGIPVEMQQQQQTVVVDFWMNLQIKCLEADPTACLMPAGVLEPNLLGHTSFILSLPSLLCSHSVLK
jgi:hypothetical protein